jgi:hypothetical protein
MRAAAEPSNALVAKLPAKSGDGRAINTYPASRVYILYTARRTDPVSLLTYSILPEIGSNILFFVAFLARAAINGKIFIRYIRI